MLYLPQEIQLFKTHVTISCKFDDPMRMRKEKCCSSALQ